MSSHLFVLFYISHLLHTMLPVSEETKDKLRKATDVAKTVVHWGFLPLVIYLGMTTGEPRPSLLTLVSPL
ncbi:hypothetical protein CAOG_02265 [Capsaspora owczarzaki ATCC 30864]|nr:hypothetical protein CAOG_02265 [Capsaspora owczarzaki ATCC 30864]|eukprot:XP_004349015.2 hypothetical protein CAOG_02265 [Capsaspora owczarzaki ATCC 30864]